MTAVSLPETKPLSQLHKCANPFKRTESWLLGIVQVISCAHRFVSS